MAHEKQLLNFNGPGFHYSVHQLIIDLPHEPFFNTAIAFRDFSEDRHNALLILNHTRSTQRRTPLIEQALSSQTSVREMLEKLAQEG